MNEKRYSVNDMNVEFFKEYPNIFSIDIEITEYGKVYSFAEMNKWGEPKISHITNDRIGEIMFHSPLVLCAECREPIWLDGKVYNMYRNNIDSEEFSIRCEGFHHRTPKGRNNHTSCSSSKKIHIQIIYK